MEIYDLIIIGGGTSGVACAYCAAKLNLKVLLIEKNSFLGGSITAGLVIPMMKSVESNINKDFLNDLYAYADKFSARIEYFDKNKGWFNPELLKIVFEKMLSDVGVDFLLNISDFDVIKSKNSKNILSSIKISSKILSLYVETNENLKKDYFEFFGKYFVDATANAILSRKINCELLEANSQAQASSLRFIMGNVDIEALEHWLLNLDANRDVTNSCKIAGQTHLTTAYTWDKDKNWALRPVFENAIENNDLKPEDSAYFQIFTVANMPSAVAFNCPRIIENTSKSDIFYESKCLIKGRQQIFRIANFCKKYFKGFKNAYISQIAFDLGVRESFRVKTLKIANENEFLVNSNIKNPILESDYPIDIHSEKKNSSVLNFPSKKYSISIETLKSFDYKNLYIVGRCLGATFKAQSALRIQSSCFSMGEAVAKEIKKII